MPDVDSKLLDPRSTWADPDAYDVKAQMLAAMFRDNFTKFNADDNIVAGGPALLADELAAPSSRR